MSTKPCTKSYHLLKLTLFFEFLHVSVTSTSFRSYQNSNEPNPTFGSQALFYPDRDLQPNTERGGICVCCNAFLPSISSKKMNPLSIFQIKQLAPISYGPYGIQKFQGNLESILLNSKQNNFNIYNDLFIYFLLFHLQSTKTNL